MTTTKLSTLKDFALNKSIEKFVKHLYTTNLYLKKNLVTSYDKLFFL